VLEQLAIARFEAGSAGELGDAETGFADAP
jgi:hypothetical protein